MQTATIILIAVAAALALYIFWDCIVALKRKGPRRPPLVTSPPTPEFYEWYDNLTDEQRSNIPLRLREWIEANRATSYPDA